MAETAAAPAGRSYRLYVLLMLTIVYTFNFLDRQILGILAAPIQEELKLSDQQFGLMVGPPFALVYATLAIPIAWWADRSSRTWIITGALAVWSGFTALCGLATNFWQLFFSRMGVGVGEAGGVAPSYSMISDYFPRSQRARALAFFSFGIPTGTALGILFGGLIAAQIDWRAAFVIVGVAGLLVAPVFRLTVRDPVRGGADAVAPAATVQPDSTPVSGPPSFGAVLKVLLPKPSFWLLAFGSAFASINGYGVALWLPTFFIRSFGLSLTETSWYYAGIAFIGGIAGIGLSGVLADRFGARSRAAYPLVPAIAFLIALPCAYIAMDSQVLWLAFLLFLIPTGLNLTWLGSILAAVQHLTPGRMRSTASAMFLLINNLIGIAFGTYYFGAVSDLLRPQFGEESMRWAIYSGFSFYVISALLFILASRTLKRDWVEG
jgi:MFS family permease